MKRILFIFCISICLFSCKSTKSSSNKSTTVTSRPSKGIIDDKSPASRDSRNLPEVNGTSDRNSNSKMADDIVDYAMKFEGVRYKYGGTDKKGMDCSGLVTTAFNSEGISLPRSSGDMALSGDWIDLKEVQKGDLLFFATNGKSRKISHVGLVTYANDGQVEFIHSSTSAGVIVSSIAERYWYFAFVQARRVL